jgi:hypothetical protein
MALPVFPAGVDYKPDMNSFRVQEAYRPPIWTEFEDGPALGRRSGIGRRARLAYRLFHRTPAEYNTFKSFVENDLVAGTSRFTMPVYVPASNSYVTKTVQIDRGQVTTDTLGLGFASTFTLLVYDW